MVAALADRQGFRKFLGASADDRDFAVPRLSRTSESQGGPCGIVTAFSDRLQLQRNSPSPVTRLSKDQSGSHGVGLQGWSGSLALSRSSRLSRSLQLLRTGRSSCCPVQLLGRVAARAVRCSSWGPFSIKGRSPPLHSCGDPRGSRGSPRPFRRLAPLRLQLLEAASGCQSAGSRGRRASGYAVRKFRAPRAFRVRWTGSREEKAIRGNGNGSRRTTPASRSAIQRLPC
jgi:hypothetical protein